MAGLHSYLGLQKRGLLITSDDYYSNVHCVLKGWYKLVSELQRKESYDMGET